MASVSARVPPRLRFVGRRLLKALPLLVAVVVFNFCLLKLAPGDAAEVLAGESAAAMWKRPAWWLAKRELNSATTVTDAPGAIGSAGSTIRWCATPVLG